MIIKVLNENPFQILTSAMSIGPSETGYVLEVSADSVNFSPLFSVAENTTKMATGLAPNSYYRLKGNEGEVTVNWSRSCVTEGGGGTASGNELVPQDNFPLDAEAGTVVALKDGGVYQYDGTDWNEIGSADMSEYWTSAQTQSAITQAVSDVEDHLSDVEEITSIALNDLNERVIEISGSTPDLSAYTPTSGFCTINGSAITEGGNAILIDEEIYESSTQAISVALNDLNNTKVSSNDIRNIVKMTQAEYDALSGNTEATTLYVITSN